LLTNDLLSKGPRNGFTPDATKLATIPRFSVAKAKPGSILKPASELQLNGERRKKFQPEEKKAPLWSGAGPQKIPTLIYKNTNKVYQGHAARQVSGNGLIHMARHILAPSLTEKPSQVQS